MRTLYYSSFEKIKPKLHNERKIINEAYFGSIYANEVDIVIKFQKETRKAIIEIHIKKYLIILFFMLT